MAFDPRELFNFYQRLSPRERVLLSAAVGSVLAISLYSFVWDPLVVGREQIERRIVAKEKELTQIQTQRERYLDLLRQTEAAQAAVIHTDQKFSLFAYIQAAVSQVISKDHIQSMNPTDRNLNEEFQEQAVEIKLTAVKLEELVNMLHRIEKGEQPLRVARLQVKKRYNDPHSFDLTATVALLRPRTGAPAAGGAS